MSKWTYDVLRAVVGKTKGPPNWYFCVAEEDGALRLVITLDVVSNFNHDKPFAVSHWHPVPQATYNEKSWRRWVFEQCLRTINHELGEALSFGGERPFRPMHGPGEDPYTVHEIRSETDARTLQDGRVLGGKKENVT